MMACYAKIAPLILCVLGTMAALRIPVQMIPDLETRTVTVETRWPGGGHRPRTDRPATQKQPGDRISRWTTPPHSDV